MKTYSRHDFTREERAARAKVAISAAFESKEQAFLDFVLSHLDESSSASRNICISKKRVRPEHR